MNGINGSKEIFARLILNTIWKQNLTSQSEGILVLEFVTKHMSEDYECVAEDAFGLENG